MALRSSCFDIPCPSSRIPTYIFSAFVGNNNRIVVHDALTLLSITSAMASANEYPIWRMEPMRYFAFGGFGILFITYLKRLGKNAEYVPLFSGVIIS